MPTDRREFLEQAAAVAGRGVDAIRDIPSAVDLVPWLWRECLDATETIVPLATSRLRRLGRDSLHM